jgi:hypothetical protein
MITRHPDEKKLLKQTKAGDAKLAPILMSTSNFNTKTSQQLSDLIDSDMADEIAPHFGPSAGKIPGKYKRADFFAFLCNGRAIITIPEKGDRGTHWYYLIQKDDTLSSGQYLSLDNEAVIDVLPAFFTELYETLYNKDLDSEGFTSQANQLRQLWRTEPQRQELDQSTPAVKNNTPKKRM